MWRPDPSSLLILELNLPVLPDMDHKRVTHLERNTVIVNAKCKVITVFSDVPGTAKGIGEGIFVPFK